MSRRGFALLAVLWVITALTALTGAGLLVARIGSTTTRNRVLLARAEWAREACGEILLARFAADASVRALEPVDLGRGTWCRASIDDPSGKVNLNTADRDVLARLFAQVAVEVAVGVAVAVATLGVAVDVGVAVATLGVAVDVGVAVAVAVDVARPWQNTSQLLFDPRVPMITPPWLTSNDRST